MQWWTPEPVWQGQDCFILGGGDSLRGWDLSVLRHEHVIGCNQAFREGPEICDYVVFADRTFIMKGKGEKRHDEFDGLARFPNPVVTNHESLSIENIPWLKVMRRRACGLHRDALGYNNNTGAVAINLALLLGAVKIYLLGFDMMLGSTGRANYHNHEIDKPSANIYVRMMTRFPQVASDLRKKFPGCEVINVSSCTQLKVFPVVDFDLFWKERSKEHGLDSGTHC